MERTATLQCGTARQEGRAQGPDGQGWRGRRKAGPARCQATGGRCGGKKGRTRSPRGGPVPGSLTCPRAASQPSVISSRSRSRSRSRNGRQESRLSLAHKWQSGDASPGPGAYLLCGAAWLGQGSGLDLRKPQDPPPLLQKPPGGQVTTVTATCARDFPGGSTE